MRQTRDLARVGWRGLARTTIAWPYRQTALLLLLSGSKRKLRHRPRWRRGGGKPQRAYPWGMPPDRATTKAAGFGPACCECPPVEVSIVFTVGLARRQDPQNRRKPPKIEFDRPKLSPPGANFKPP